MRDVKGYEGLYAVSREGRIWSYPKKKQGGHKGRFLVGKMSGTYKAVVLAKDGEYKKFTVHRIVALSYIENPENCGDVNHKNGNKLDNRVENLEWCTRSENIRHAFKLGLSKRGEKHGGAKLKDLDVLAIKYMLSLGEMHKEIAKEFPVAISTIADISRQKSWKWLKL